jgi:hypothetical protein
MQVNTSLQLNDGARPDEKFHIQHGVPQILKHFDYKVIRRTVWSLVDGYFVSLWLFNHLQIYYGTMKCDGSRTYWAWKNRLTQPGEYVITTTPKELVAFRWRKASPGIPVWDNMGGT